MLHTITSDRRLFRSHLAALGSTLSLCAILAGCGGGGSSSSDDGGTTPPPVATTTHDFVADPAQDLTAFNISRDGSGNVQFTGRIGVMRKALTQDAAVRPPAKLTLRFSNASTNFFYATGTATRGAFQVGDDLGGTAPARGVCYYNYFNNFGFSLPGGTQIKVEILDNGDGAVASGDEFGETVFFVNVPLAPATSPVPFGLYTVPGAG